MLRSPLLLLGFATLSGCILLPPTIRERLAETSEGSGGEGGVLGQGGESEGGGVAAGEALPICSSGETTDCATIVALAPGDTHSCALASDGFVRCWGGNWRGEIGDPSLPGGDHVFPHVVTGLSEVRQLVAGAHHTCAVVGTEAYCWGANHASQLGVQDLVDRPEPVKISLQEPVEQISTMRHATCALTTNSEVYCWGRTINGQNYDGMQLTPKPTKVDGLDDLDTIDEIQLGETFACALGNSRHEIRCWGRNVAGYLGDGTDIPSVSAVSVTDALARPVELFAVSSGQACITGGNPLRHQCWGNFTDALDTYLFEPTELSLEATAPLVAVDMGWRHLCRLREDGVLRCAGHSEHGEIGPSAQLFGVYPDPIPVLGGAAGYAAGWQHNCALMNQGDVRCWGRNGEGQVDPSSGDHKLPNPVTVEFGP